MRIPLVNDHALLRAVLKFLLSDLDGSIEFVESYSCAGVPLHSGRGKLSTLSRTTEHDLGAIAFPLCKYGLDAYCPKDGIRTIPTDRLGGPAVT